MICRSVKAAGAVVVFLGMAGCARESLDLPTPVPPVVQVITPAAEIPTPIAAFSGIWTGDWEPRTPSAPRVRHTLIVQSIEPLDQGRYRVATVASWDAGQPGLKGDGGYVHVWGAIGADGILRLAFSRGVTTAYRLSADRQQLLGELTRPSPSGAEAREPQRGVLKRTEHFQLR